MDAEHDAGATAAVNRAAAGHPPEEVGSQVAFDGGPVPAIVSTLMLLAFKCIWLLQRRQHLQHHAPGAVATQKHDLAKELMHSLVMSLNKIASPCLRASGTGDTPKEQLNELRTLLSA